ncbi:hypothetical protein MRS44_010547 [Fusarium solani]|uniref:uncharacterized protein n=1 Tax=Fusarium solani TaxID=169388 RepID=UPI0032C40D0A|nr:hypothetical protein MRS44_010547 [Fusarium solani]
MTHARDNGSPNPHGEDRGLLAAGHDFDDDEYFGVGDDDALSSGSGSADLAKGGSGKAEDANGGQTPRTPGRVRFDLTPEIVPVSNGDAFGGHGPRGSEDDAYFDMEEAASPARAHRMPLLTGIEAPSVTVANSMGDPGELAEHEMNRPKSGLKSAFMNMANSIIGAGIIGQPYAVRQAGLVGGILLLVGLTVVVDWTICLIVINSKLSGTSHFQGTVEHCFGQPGLIAISVAQWVFAFGGMVAYGVIVGDTIPHVLKAIWPDLPSVPVLGLLANRQVAITVFVLGIGYPLTLYRDISKLAKASTFALVGMLVIVVTVLIQGVLTPASERGSFSPSLLLFNGGFFQAIGVISFDPYHRQLFPSYSLLYWSVDAFCLVLALGGFLTFGDKTLGNVLNNFPADSTMVNVARLCFGLNMLTTLPLEAFVCREVMLTYFFPDEPFNMNRHLLFSTSLVVAALVLSLVTCDLGAVFELVGATSAVAMAYILPPMCYIKLTTRSWRTYMAYAVVVFGVVVMVISVLQAVQKMISNKDGPAVCA